MSVFYTMDVQNTVVSCKGETLEAAKDEATKTAAVMKKFGSIVTLDDFGVEVMPGLCLWNVLVKKRNYR